MARRLNSWSPGTAWCSLCRSGWCSCAGRAVGCLAADLFGGQAESMRERAAEPHHRLLPRPAAVSGFLTGILGLPAATRFGHLPHLASSRASRCMAAIGSSTMSGIAGSMVRMSATRYVSGSGNARLAAEAGDHAQRWQCINKRSGRLSARPWSGSPMVGQASPYVRPACPDLSQFRRPFLRVVSCLRAVRLSGTTSWHEKADAARTRSNGH